MKTLLAIFVLSLPLVAQNAVQQLLYYSGSNLAYICTAKSTQPRTTPGFAGASAASGTITVSAASNASPVSFTATGHNLFYTATGTVLPIVRISGGTGSWAAINGSFTATPTSANAFTIPVDSTAFGALTGTLVVTTTSPKMNEAVWKVEALLYDASSNLIFHGYAGGTDNVTQICANRATLAYQ